MIASVSTHLPRLLRGWMRGVAWRVDHASGHRVLHLTFDDGPSDRTAFMLDVLDEFDARVTFFLLGEAAIRHVEEVREILRRGHTIGCHGFIHLDAWRSRSAQTRDDFERGCRTLEAITGGPVRLLRPPYGHLRPALVRWARKTGRRVVLWDLMPADYLPRATPEGISRFVTRKAVSGSIVVLHDNPKSAPVTPAALRVLLPALRSRGWTLDRLDPAL